MKLIHAGAVRTAGCLLLSSLLGLASAEAQGTQPTRIKRLGTSNAFHRKPLKSVADLQKLFADKRPDLERALVLAGWPGDAAELFRTVEQGQVTETIHSPGTAFPWMVNRKKRQVNVIQNVIWDGKAPFPAYELTFVSRDTRWTFVVPKVCSNLALLSSQPIAPPVCKLTVTPASDCITRELTIDASGSSVSHGTLSDVEVEVSLPDGSKEKLAGGKGYRWTRSYDRPGTYTFSCVAVADSGRRSETVTARAELRPCPPACSIVLSVPELYTGEEFSLDASGSKAQVGTLASVEVTVVDATGTEVSRMDLKAPYTAHTKFKESGTYTFRAVAVDSLGQRSTDVCEATFVSKPRLGYFAELLAGKERRWRDELNVGRCAPLVGGKFGPAYRIKDNAEVAAGLGLAFNTRDNDNSSLFADLEVNWIGSGGLLGAGIGIWDFTHGDYVTGSVFVHGGVNTPWRIKDRPVVFLLEGRLPFDGTDDIENNYILWGGLRFYF